MPTTSVEGSGLDEENLAPVVAAPEATVPTIVPHADRSDALSLFALDAAELSPQQRAVSVMQNFQINEEAFFAETAEKLDEIMQLVPSRAFKALDLLFEEYFSTQITNYITGTLLPQVPEGHPDFTVERAAKFDQTVLKAVQPQTVEYTTWFRLLASVADFKNRVIQRYTESNAGKEHMHPAARLEYVHFHDIAEATNELYLAWHNDCGKLLSVAERQERGFKDDNTRR